MRNPALILSLVLLGCSSAPGELSYPLETRGQKVPLRIKTDRLESDEVGALVAAGATLTTCSHEQPHFVVRTRKFSLSPRDDGRWRFAARGNRIKRHFWFGCGFWCGCVNWCFNRCSDQRFGMIIS